MRQTPSGAAAFRTAYYELIEELVRRFGSSQESRWTLQEELMRSPLEMPPRLVRTPKSGALEKRFANLVQEAATAMSRDELSAIASEVIRDILGLQEAAVGGDAGLATPAPAGKPRRAKRGVSKRVARPSSPPPGRVPPSGWTHSTPPMVAIGGGEARTLGANRSVSPQRPVATSPTDMPQPPEIRYVNAAIADQPSGQPLAVEKEYLLEVWVGLEEKGDASAVFPSSNLSHQPDEEVIELTIQVTSDDFTVAQDFVPLKLPRSGPSRGKARFDISTKREGRGTLTIVVHKQGNLVLQMKVGYSVGNNAAKPVSVQVVGRPLAAATQLQERKLSFMIEPVSNGYSCTVSGATATRVILRITETELGDIVKEARDSLLSVVSLQDNDSRKYVFQNGIDIDAAFRARTLRILANAGATLFQRIFFGQNSGLDVNRVGTLLRDLATRKDRSYTFQFNVDRFPVPWGMMYFGKAGDNDALDWDLFLGLRHVVEQIPFQAGSLVVDTEIHSGPALAVSINFNTSIDTDFDLQVVEHQLAFWRALAQKAGSSMTLVEGLKRQDILDSFERPSGDQLTYLYCHAEASAPGQAGGINASCFVFASGERLTLKEMRLNAPMSVAFPGNPLVFINACESAQLRPEFYDGFIPYFMAKGARGVVGTECETPATFASEWALQFFPRFLTGEPLGKVFLDLRREFLEKHGNPLGFLYNVYCNADTQVQPGLKL